MKKIVITQRLMLNDSYYELREALDVNWALLFSELNFLPIVLPTKYDFEKYFESINIDGILLTGGNDLNSINVSEVSKQRDVFEKKLIEYGIQNDIPIFGVCRGMQIIAEYFEADFTEVKNQVAIKHNLRINQESKYFIKLNKIGEVNSFHNYAIHNLSNEFLVSATNEDEMIKAIEHTKYKIFGQMWHSEREEPFRQEELMLIKDFFCD
ncbi:C26 family cysteine hydrolase domain-containing family [Candidatus Woesearchaeota archaeon]|jgi:N5-(cytidine 5'-diphosphoramidyl)-L-glutamine hydrolase|nr:C26 family cysteine hydrolase domain-containing family [Candidatus Woesearchaeota archaeon]